MPKQPKIKMNKTQGMEYAWNVGYHRRIYRSKLHSDGLETYLAFRQSHNYDCSRFTIAKDTWPNGVNCKMGGGRKKKIPSVNGM